MEKVVVQDKEHLSALYLHRVRPNGLSTGSSATSPNEIGLFDLVAHGCTESIGPARRSRFALQIAKVGALNDSSSELFSVRWMMQRVSLRLIITNPPLQFPIGPFSLRLKPLKANAIVR